MTKDYVLNTVKTLQEANIKIPIKTQIHINFEEIKANLESGIVSKRMIYISLINQKKIDCTYPAFCKALRNYLTTNIILKDNNNTNQTPKLSFDKIKKEHQLKVASNNQKQMIQRTQEDIEKNIKDLI